MISRQIYKVSHDAEAVGAWQRAVLVVAVIVRMVAGVAAFAFLTTTRPVEHRVTWVLLPPKDKTLATSPRAVAAADMLAARM